MIGFWYGSGLTLKSIPMVAVDVSGSKVSSQYLINTIACVDHGQHKDKKQPFARACGLSCGEAIGGVYKFIRQ